MENIENIISKYCSGSITDGELEDLFLWVNSSVENEKYFAESKIVWETMHSFIKDEEVNVDDDFTILKNKINSENEHIRKTDLSRRILSLWRNIAAVLLIPILIAGLLINNKYQVNDLIVENVKSDIVSKEMYTPKGVRANFELEDGTKVWLNSNSNLKYSYDFKSRNIELDGEAYFEVAHDKELPFIVSSRGLKVKVLGTTFNVNTYEKNKIETTLLEGSVELINDSNNSKPTILKPGERAIYQDDKSEMPTSKVDTKYITAWKDGYILFRDTPMKDVITSLERWYGVDISIKNPTIYQYSFTANLRDKNLPQILDLIRLSSPIGYKINGKNVVIYHKKN
ncbi:MAG: DUF4974 domain-containing protein [Labilibaculum sp.]|nr:FecR domain-containing protein [Labilibaculum sp.]MBI9059053.1 DUF4974 domain-containing protein [Labilibaculum sp.]